MRKFVTYSLLLVSLFTFSCNKDDEDSCDDIYCENGGTCSDGRCNCPTFYEGSTCETNVLEKYGGNYDVLLRKTSASDGSIRTDQQEQEVWLPSYKDTLLATSRLIGDVQYLHFYNESEFTTSGKTAVGTQWETYVSGRGSFGVDYYEHWDTTYQKSNDTIISYQYVRGERIN